jgi:hypothetical protein
MMGRAMGRMRPTRDIQPITEFRANEALIDQIELLRDIRVSERQIAEGKVVSNAAVMKKLRAILAKPRSESR